MPYAGRRPAKATVNQDHGPWTTTMPMPTITITLLRAENDGWWMMDDFRHCNHH